MSNSANSALTTRLYLEGIEIDLDENISIDNTYAVSDVRDIGSKNSSYSKTITLPGTANNDKLFSYLFDIKSTGTDAISPFALAAPGFSVFIINALSDGTTIIGGDISGSTLTLPIAGGGSDASIHNQINNTDIYLDIAGQTGIGYIICYLNSSIIACNRISEDVSRYYFPKGQYNFDDTFVFVFQADPISFSGNIGYDLNFKKKMRAHVIQDNAVILTGYAKMVSSVSNNGWNTYQIQITSDLGGFISTLANLRLEDLWSTQAPDIILDPTGATAKTISLPSPYDHSFQIANIIASWYDDPFNQKPYAYPLADYGNNDTTGLTNFYTSNLRPALFAKSYWDDIFNNAGYTYDSAFLNSDYFGKLIIPYKDGIFSIINTNPSQITSSGTTICEVSPVSGTDPVNELYFFNTIVSDPNSSYDITDAQYNCDKIGNYLVNVSFALNYNVFPGAGTSGLQMQNRDTFIFVHLEQYHAGDTAPYLNTVQLYTQVRGTITFGGVNYFIDDSISDNFVVQINNVPLNIQTSGDFIKVRVSSSNQGDASNFFVENGTSTNFPGTSYLSIVNAEITKPILNIAYDGTNLDGQFFKFEDFVPKSVKQIDYINSIVKLFNLYPVQDRDKRNHFNIFTRDEFFASQKTLDWTSKLDLLSDITVRPIPELDASQLLFSYKPDKDWWNKQYNSLYGDFTYGSLRVQTGYDFANKVNDVVSGLIFAPTPVVEFGQNSYPGESLIEIINGDTTASGSFPSSDVSSDIILVSGYYSGNGKNTPCQLQLAPTGNSVSGQPFTKARVGVKIVYWGLVYVISTVMNPWAFQVTNVDGTPATLRRPITQGTTQERISDTLYAANDGFQYLTDSNIAIPCIYDSSDNNVTHQPVKTEMKILHYSRLNGSTDKLYNPFYLQLTPILQNNSFIYQPTGFAISATTDSQVQEYFSYPYCSHLDDPDNPTIDLLFGKPVSVFFTIDPIKYPKLNLYSRFWINTVNEITDKDAKFIECMLNLNSVDIAKLDLSNTIFINGTNFRINSIKDYSPDASLTLCELIRMPMQVPVVGDLIVDAGADQTVSGSTETVLDGSASWSDGGVGEFVSSAAWLQIDGPSDITITDPTSLDSSVTGIVEGNEYELQLTIIDNYGRSGVDTMFILGAPPSPCTPFVTASNSGPINLPTNNASLIGTADGCLFPVTTIVSTVWTQISGSTLTIINSTSLTATASGITTTGNYTFRLTVTDSNGNTNYADTTLVVNPQPDPTLTLSFIDGGGSFLQFEATLSYAINANIDITQLFVDGYAAADCSGSSTAAAQYTSGTKTITAGSTGVGWAPDSHTGTWSGTIMNKVFNAIVNGSARVNGNTFTCGSFTVHVIISNCEPN